MKFKWMNIKNISQLVPTWAMNPVEVGRKLDEMFSRAPEMIPKNLDKTVPFWIEVDLQAQRPNIRFCTADDSSDNSGQFIIKCRSYAGQPCQIEFSLNAIFKGYDSISGQYAVYFHSFQTETPLTYIGMTRNAWHERFAQHLSAARSGSQLIFHRALIEHQKSPILHRVYLYGLEKGTAEDFEEESVNYWSLYPLGLNMIPGGKAGLKYLSRFGIRSTTSENLPFLLKELSKKESIDGYPNPLCAARWANDADFVERVICGHSGRLTADQVRAVKRFGSFGISRDRIMDMLGLENAKQVERLMKDKTYRRIT